jgi:hypothetical protein
MLDMLNYLTSNYEVLRNNFAAFSEGVSSEMGIYSIQDSSIEGYRIEGYRIESKSLANSHE